MSMILADIFTSKEAREILRNKFVLMIGDSVVRSCYKDLVKFLQTDAHLQDYQLKNKGEKAFENDVLLEGGSLGVMSNDVTYTEVREFKTNVHLVRFYFITRCYSDYLISICEDIKDEPEKPDVVIMNSGCWDLTRYGANSINEYKKNLPNGIFSLIKVLPSHTVFIWNTTLPLSKDVKGGFMIPEVYEKKSKLREDVLEANHYAVNVMKEFKLDVLDLHYYFLNHIQRRAKDGIHWDATAHRRISNLMLHHLCEVWDIDTPGRIVFKNNSRTMDLPQDFNFYEDNENFESFNYEDSNSSELPPDLLNKLDNVVHSIETGYNGDVNNNSAKSNFNINSNNNNNNNNNNIINHNNNNNNKNKKLKTNHNIYKNGFNSNGNNRQLIPINTGYNFNQYNQAQNALPNLNMNNPLNGQVMNPFIQVQLQNQLTQFLTPIIHQSIVQQPSPTLYPNQFSLNQNFNGINKRKFSGLD